MILKGSPSKYLLVPLLTLTVAYFLVFNHYLPGMDTNGILSAKITKDPFDPLELSGFCSCNNRSVASASERTQKKVVVYSLFGDPTNRNIRQRYYQQLEKRIQEIALRLPGGKIVHQCYTWWVLFFEFYGWVVLRRFLIWTEWGIRVYHNVSANNYICSLACKYHGLIQFYNVSHPQYETERRINPRLWRFLPLLDGSVEMMLSRDLDSNVSEREVAAVREWMNSNLSFHIMRDHPQHGVFILAGATQPIQLFLWAILILFLFCSIKGMWGAKLAEHPQLVRNLGKIMLVMGKAQDKEADQRFLWVYVWPITQFDTVRKPVKHHINKKHVAKTSWIPLDDPRQLLLWTVGIHPLRLEAITSLPNQTRRIWLCWELASWGRTDETTKLNRRPQRLPPGLSAELWQRLELLLNMSDQSSIHNMLSTLQLIDWYVTKANQNNFFFY